MAIYIKWINKCYISQSRLVSYDTDIFVIGGRDWNNNPSNLVHIIDTITNDVYLWQYRLVYAAPLSAPIIVNHRLYAFGGSTAYAMYKYQYIDLLSLSMLNNTCNSNNKQK